MWYIGKALGVRYEGYKMNRFNLLSRAGRREWRAEGVSSLMDEGVGGSGDGGEGR